MTDFVADTHAVIWYLEDNARLGPQASACFDACDRGEAVVFVPIVCLVEMVYLEERGVIPVEMRVQLTDDLRTGSTGLRIADLNPGVVEALAAIPRSEIPEMPDRIIAATAHAMGLPLLTRDHRIRRSDVETIW